MTGRRSSPALAALLAGLVAVLSGCGGEQRIDAVDAVAAGVCDPVERPPLQQGSHLIGDTAPPVPYSSSPPTSGWHSSGPGPVAGVYDTPIPDPQLVSVLERGGVVVAHGGPLGGDEVATLRVVADDVDDVVIAPYESDDDVVLLAWGALQRCVELDADAVAGFAASFGGTGLHPT